MLVRIFTLKFHTATERFDDEELQKFIKDKDVLSVREHFFLKHNTPYLILVVTYLPGTGDIVSAGKKKETWRESLSNEQLPLFDALREWRTERAKQDGVPPYVICTNQQLADMVAARPDSLAGLSKIHGFGKGKSEKYGKVILTMLSTKQEDEQGSQDQQQVMFNDKPDQTEPTKGKDGNEE